MSAMAVHELPPLTADRVHHVGMSVADLDAALGFWEPFLGVEARWRTVLDRPYLGVHVGYPGVRIAAAFLDLPGGTVLELLDYQVRREDANCRRRPRIPAARISASQVDDARSAWERAVACGARPSCRTGRSTVDGGPNRGRARRLPADPRRGHARALPAADAMTEQRYERLHPAELRAVRRRARRLRTCRSGRSSSTASTSRPGSTRSRRTRSACARRRGAAASCCRRSTSQRLPRPAVHALFETPSSSTRGCARRSTSSADAASGRSS